MLSRPFHSVKPKSERVRPWPYPFRAGLSISNDAEFMSFEFFETLMTFLNTNEETVWGRGLGIPVTSSVFFFSAHAYNFSYFDGHAEHTPLSPYAAKIREYISKGLIDTIHAYGDFDRVGGFKREHAVRCFEELKKYGLSIPVFTNHGGTENVQNIGLDAAYHEGDLPSSTAYHADLLRASGARYVWTDSMVTQWVQKKKLTLHGFYHGLRRALKDTLLGRKKKPKPDIIHDVVLQDQSRVKGFVRFRSTGQNAPNLSSLRHQIDQIDWQNFYDRSEAVVLYQHLGVLNRMNGVCKAATIEDVRESKSLYLAPFYKIKEEHNRGDLWVARLIDFLDYIVMAESMNVHKDGGVYTIEQDGSMTDKLSGLTIYVDTSEQVSVQCGGKDIPFRVNGPDNTGQYSVTIL